MMEKILAGIAMVFLAANVFAQGPEPLITIDASAFGNLFWAVIGVVIIIGLVSLILFLWALIDIIKSEKTTRMKLVWILICFFLSIIGIIIYALVGREKGERIKEVEVEEKEGGKHKFELYEKYKEYLKQAGWKIDANIWILVSILVGVVIGLVTAVIIYFTGLPISQLMSFVFFLVVADLMLGKPYLQAIKKINLIEEALPDALRQMSDTLKAGGTYEYALREISTAEHGPLTNEMNEVLRKLEEGENLENSLNWFAERVDSRLVKRSIAVITDSIKAGAGLADVLEEISDDIREMHRIDVERKARTIMQVLFIVAAGAIVTPFILGLVSTIVSFLIEAAASGLAIDPLVKAQAITTSGLITTLMQAYLIIEIVAAGIMIALMREGSANKSIIYIPILLLVAYTIYYISLFWSGAFIGGTI